MMAVASCRKAVCIESELGPWEAHVMQVLPLEVDLILGLDVVLKVGLAVEKRNDEVVVKFGGKVGVGA